MRKGNFVSFGCTMELWRVLFLFPMAMSAAEGSCRFYVKKFEANYMECFLTRGDPKPVCQTGEMSNEYCRVTKQLHDVYIKWEVNTSITCKNNTNTVVMEGTEKIVPQTKKSPHFQLCESLDCTKEFSSDPQNVGDSVFGIKAGWGTVLWHLIIVLIAWFAAL